MKTKLSLLIAVIALMVTSFGCKKTNCCVLPEENNAIIALKNGDEWRTTGYLFKYNTRTDTVAIAGSKGRDALTITIKKSGNGYIMMEATFYDLTGDIINADYILDASKNNSFDTTTSTNELLEGKFTLYFKLNHGDSQYPKTIVFKNGLFRIRWDNLPPPGSLGG